MAKKASGMGTLVTFIAWLTGVIVSLAVGFSLMSGGALNSDFPSWLGGTILANIAGWIVVIVTILGAIMAIAGRFKQ